MRPFDYVAPDSIEEARALLAEPGSRVLAGGTDLLREIGAGSAAPERLVSLRRLADMEGIRRRPDGGLAIGARTTLAAIMEHVRIRDGYAALAEAAAGTATPQLRNVATLAGSLLQRPACEYYRTDFACALKGGQGCPAREGDNTHHAVLGSGICVSGHPGDAAAALLALGAQVTWVEAAGLVTVPLAGLYRLPDAAHPTECALPAGAIVTAIELPPPSGASGYLQSRDRAAWAFALVGVAARIAVRRGRIVEAGVALCGAAPIPWRLPDVESFLLGTRTAGDDWAREAGRLATSGARPLACNGYKVALIEGLVARLLIRLAQPARRARPA